jgi:hypothetical protein
MFNMQVFSYNYRAGKWFIHPRLGRPYGTAKLTVI